MDDDLYALLKRQVQRHLAIDLDLYKQRQMRRRIETWVDQQGEEPRALIESLGSRPATLAEMRDMLTINVTEFFRDAQQWTKLERDVLPGLLERATRFRVWSAACSTGDEPYTLSILLEEAGARTSTILATDLDRGALAKARTGGPYTKEALVNVSKERLATHFREGEGGVYINEAIKRRVLFKELNLLSDRFESGFDLIVCRNVTIYFESDAKVALMRRFLGALKPGGVLFIGATEALLGAESEGFTRMGGNFYQKADEAVPARRAA
jgi:chemotaxis protein methyltransferase CheR